ncbi:MAG TPA: phage baseplate assembly protein [Patescibacteria group bacterium]|nr:phage baseplate assembly protein [Patescibacteria group bacterium]
MIHGALDRLFRRVMMMVCPCRLTTATDTGPAQMWQIDLGDGEIRDNIPRLGEWGLSSLPPAGSDGLAIYIGGDRSNGAVIATGNQGARMRGLKYGEVAIHDDQGQSVYITRSGIVINGGGKPVTITNTPKVRAETPRLEVTGDIIENCDTQTNTVAQMRALYDAHTHGGILPGGGSTTTPSNHQ